MEERKPGKVAVASWVSYDIANTVFWVGVVGLSFPLSPNPLSPNPPKEGV